MIRLLESNSNHMVIISDENKVETIPLTSYHILKVLPEYSIYRNDEGRITWNFESGSAQETYDTRIFNIKFNNKRFQLRELQADKLCDIILNNDNSGFLELAGQCYQEQNQEDLVKLLLEPFLDRLKITKKGIYIDGIFKVGWSGTAFVREILYDKHKGISKFKHLCIVPKGLVREQRINTPMGEMVLNPVLQTIISKIVFLLHPNMQDKVFTNQLGNKLKRLLTDESKHGVKV